MLYLVPEGLSAPAASFEVREGIARGRVAPGRYELYLLAETPNQQAPPRGRERQIRIHDLGTWDATLEHPQHTVPVPQAGTGVPVGQFERKLQSRIGR
jgi:hypothetical protein